MKTILFVEDDKGLLFAMSLGFTPHRSEFEFLIAENGKEALDFLKKKDVDIVITDLSMPVMDGYDLILWIKSNVPSVNILVLTAYLPGKIDRELRKLVSNRILMKPVNFNTLVEAVMNLAKGLDSSQAPAGVSVEPFLKLSELRKKSGIVNVFGEDGRSGRICFENGRQYDAVCGEKTGAAALDEIKQWKNIRVSLPEWQEFDGES